jgi:hypothetical protein
LTLSAIDFALLYARRGWYVFPVWGITPEGACECPKGSECGRNAGKHPIPSLVPRGDHDSTLHEATIRSWWAAKPSAGVGVALDPSGLVALDVDVSGDRPGRESLSAIADELPPTMRAVTGSGGDHLVFTRTDDSQRARLIRIRPGLDLIGKGYIVAAPSKHYSGGVYHWTDLRAPAPLPPVLASMFHEKRPKTVDGDQTITLGSLPPATPEMLEHARKRLERHGPAVVGQGGDQHTFEVGAILLRGYGLTWEEAWPLALEWNDAHTGRKWSPERLAEKLRNGAVYGQGGVGELRADIEFATGFSAWLAEVTKSEAGSWEADVAQALLDVQALLGTATERRIEPLFKPMLEIIEAQYPPTPWLIEGLLTDGGVAVIATEPKSAKTWAATELAMALATGTDAFGAFKVPKAVDVTCFYAEDMGAAVRNRTRALAVGRGMSVGDAVARMRAEPKGKSIDVTNDVDCALIVASVRRAGGTKLLVLDPMRDIHSGEEDSSDAMAGVMKRLRAIGTLLDCTVLFVHHAAKSGADTGKRRQGQRMRGSGAIHGAIDSGIYLSDLQGNGVDEFTNTVYSEIKGAKGAGTFSLTLRIEDGSDGTAIRASWEVKRETVEERAAAVDAKSDERLLEVMRKAGPRVWREIRLMSGMKGELADGARDRLLLARVIEEVTETVYDSLHRATKKKVMRIVASDTPRVPDSDS